MMIAKGTKEIIGAGIGGRAIAAIYKGWRLVWEAVSNCIAGGWWQRGHGWQHGAGWREKQGGI